MRDEVLPAIQQTEDRVGLSMLADRDSGRCIVATAWKDEQAMRATAAEDRTVQHRLLHTVGGEHADVQEWEIVSSTGSVRLGTAPARRSPGPASHRFTSTTCSTPTGTT